MDRLSQPDALGLLLDDDEGHRLGAQLAADHLPDAAKAADQVMVGERLDALFHPSPPKEPLELPLHDVFGERHDS
jgi:hypothetical protein